MCFNFSARRQATVKTLTPSICVFPSELSEVSVVPTRLRSRPAAVPKFHSGFSSKRGSNKVNPSTSYKSLIVTSSALPKVPSGPLPTGSFEGKDLQEQLLHLSQSKYLLCLTALSSSRILPMTTSSDVNPAALDETVNFRVVPLYPLSAVKGTVYRSTGCASG